jgi:predicted nucleotidyltransferase
MMLHDDVATHDLPAEGRRALAASLGVALSGEPHVRAAFLFGSFTIGGPFRDVDVAVWMDEPFTLLDVGRLAGRLWRGAGTPLFPIDVVPLNDASPAFQVKATDAGVVLHERQPGDAAEIAVAARSELLDLEYALRLTGDSVMVAP